MADFCLESGDFLGGHGRKVRVIRFCEFLIVSEVALGSFESVPERECLFQLAMLAENFSGALGIREKLGIAHGLLQFGKSFAAFGNERGIVHFRRRKLRGQKL